MVGAFVVSGTVLTLFIALLKIGPLIRGAVPSIHCLCGIWNDYDCSCSACPHVHRLNVADDLFLLVVDQLSFVEMSSEITSWLGFFGELYNDGVVLL